jgi:hypothetical protein
MKDKGDVLHRLEYVKSGDMEHYRSFREELDEAADKEELDRLMPKVEAVDKAIEDFQVDPTGGDEETKERLRQAVSDLSYTIEILP